MLKKDFPHFNPTGLTDHIKEVSTEMFEISQRRWNWINDTVHGHVVTTLEEERGDDWFNKSISNKEIKKKCYEKMIDDQDPKPIHVYLDFIQLKVIVEQKENFPLFQDTLSFAMPNERSGKAKYLEWFDAINLVRRNFAHNYGRTLSDADIETLAFVESQLRKRIPDAVDD
jgi:hypothetical protein